MARCYWSATGTRTGSSNDPPMRLKPTLILLLAAAALLFGYLGMRSSGLQPERPGLSGS